MTSIQMEALEKLEREKQGKFSGKEGVVKDAVVAALACFSKQSNEFAETVVNGGSLEECLKAVVENVGNSLSDSEAFKRAAQHYMPGAEVEYTMTIRTAAKAERPKVINLSLADLLMGG